MSERPAVRARNAILAAPWAMTPEMVATMLAIAERENLTPEAVAAQLGRPLDNTRSVAVRDGVAVIPVEGVISRHMSLFSEISGGTSIEALATDLRAALDSAAVQSILLHIDSPGGEVNGVGEFAAMVRAAGATKPVSAYVGGMAASAAYWIAAAAGEVVVDRSALVGNIGVIMAVPDPDKRQSRSIEFVSSQSPHKRPDPRTEGGRTRLQGLVDSAADVFIGAVADYRAMTPEAVAATEGDILIGQAAIDAGLADRLGSFEGVIAALQAKAREPRRMSSGGRMAAQQEGTMTNEQPKRGRADRFFAWLAGEGDDSAFAAANIAADGGPSVPAVAPVAPVAQAPAQPHPEVEAMRAELARLKAQSREGIPAAAAAFAEAEIRAGRALPVESDALAASYTEAAQDDADFPREGHATRVERLIQRQAARPAHALTTESIPVRANGDGTLSVIDNPQATATEGGEPQWSPERWRDLRAHTRSGRLVLSAMGLPESGPLTQDQRRAIAARSGVKLPA